MDTELLEIQPSELKFTFELKKQSSCCVQLANKSDHYVAFKVKTTSPKKYCVRPNTGIVKPNATCEFTVTMQAPRVASPDFQCKDKFLIQSIVVPFGTSDESITSDMFAKYSGRYIEEKKLRVALISPPSPPVLTQINVETNQTSLPESSAHNDRHLSGVENIPPHKSARDIEDFETVKVKDELTAAKDVDLPIIEDVEEKKLAKDVASLNLTKDIEGFETAKVKDELTAAKDVDLPIIEDVEEKKLAKDVVSLNLTKDFEELKLKLNAADSKVKEAELTILKLTEEKSINAREKDMLRHQLETMRKNNMRQVQVGFPALYVFMIAIISLAAGYLVHA